MARVNGWNRLKILPEAKISEIYEASLEIIRTVGIAFHHQDALRFLSKSGIDVDSRTKIARFPPAVVKEAIRKIPQVSCTLYSRDSNKSIEIGSGQQSFRSCGFARHIIDFRSGERRDATLHDLEQITIIDDALDAYDSMEPAAMPCDVPSALTAVKAAESLLTNTSKPVEVTCPTSLEAKYIFKMAESIVDGAENLRKKPIIYTLVQPTNPLKYSEEAIEKMDESVRRGIPIFLCSNPMCGISGPVTLAGMVALIFAEVIGGLTYILLRDDRTPVIPGFASIMTDMKDGSGNIGSPESTLVKGAAIQLAHFVGIAASTGGGTNSKLPTMQTGYEKALSTLFLLLSGTDVCGNFGILDDWATTASEQHVIDAEMINAIKRLLEGFEVSPETIALEVIRKVGMDGRYLSQKHTLDHFTKEHWIPEIFFSGSWDTLRRRTNKTIVDNAQAKAAKILQTHIPEPLGQDRKEDLERVVKEAAKNLLG